MDYKWLHTCSIYASGVKYSHFTCIYSWQNYMKNWLLVASFVLRCQFQNSTLVMTCEKIKVGFHYLGISWSKKLEKISIITLGCV